MTFELDEIDVDLVPEWMKKMKEIFQELEKERLPKNRREYDYTIELTQKVIFSSLLISTRSKKQKIIKTYLNNILKKK